MIRVANRLVFDSTAHILAFVSCLQSTQYTNCPAFSSIQIFQLLQWLTLKSSPTV